MLPSLRPWIPCWIYSVNIDVTRYAVNGDGYAAAAGGGGGCVVGVTVAYKMARLLGKACEEAKMGCLRSAKAGGSDSREKAWVNGGERGEQYCSDSNV